MAGLMTSLTVIVNNVSVINVSVVYVHGLIFL